MEVDFTIDSGIGIITINRPEVRNAVNGNVARGISEAIKCVNQDKSIKAAIVTGSGGNFCAGMDLKAFLRGEEVRTPDGGFAGITAARVSKPMIAAIEGYALAGGFEIALACDIVVASRTAKVGLPEVKRGLVANAGGLLRLPRQLPERIAVEMVLTGDIYSVESLTSYGLFNRLVEPGQALSEAVAFAVKFAANGPMAMAVCKQVLRESRLWSEDEMFKRQSVLTAPVFASADAREGAIAFTEKRTPNWRGE